MTATHRYRCPCGIVYCDQIEYERHLFVEHNRLRDPIAAVIGDN
jgi:hypothetical protein